jgi:hypothetical protein
MITTEKGVGSALRVEYRIEQMPIQEHPEAHLEQLLDRLNELGRQGWRVVSIDLTHHPSYSPAAQPGIQLPVLLEKSSASTQPIEYRIERMPFQETPAAHLSEVLDRVNELGKQGWCVASIDLTHHPSYSPAAQPSTPLPMLMEREI